jgi:hypothetical protein
MAAEDVAQGVNDALEEAMAAVENTLATSSRDWANDGRDAAWLYGIVLGWDPDPEDAEDGSAMDEVAERFGWPPPTVERLRQLHAAWAGRP